MEGQCSGTCHACGSERLLYDGHEFDADSMYFEYECEDCGAQGEEWYKLTYIGSTSKGEEL